VLISALHLPTYTRLRRFRRPGQQVRDHGTPALKSQEAAAPTARDAAVAGSLGFQDGKAVEFLLVLDF